MVQYNPATPHQRYRDRLGTQMQTQVLTHTYTLILCLLLTGSAFTFGCSEAGVDSSETSDKLWDDEGSWDDTDDGWGSEDSWSSAGSDESWDSAGSDESWDSAGSDESWDSAGSDETWDSAGSDETWDSAGSDESWDSAGSDETNTQHSPSVNAGDMCAPGCIWSSYAVEMNAQWGQASCGGAECACVVSGDIWTACEPGQNQGNQNQGNQNQGNQNQGNQNQGNTNSNHPSGSYDAALGGRIADAAYAEASRRGTTGYCYNAAADAIESVVGAFLYGMHAYMAADQLAGHARFAEVSVSDLRSLPAGAVVVWSRGSSESGHISIALGDGREASDHITSQMTSHYGGGHARVFFPR
jgi:hypothetical protein